MKFLFVGDVVGKGGRKAVKELVPQLREKYNCSFCVVNGENSAGGAGVNTKCVKEILEVADVVTTGDHVWDQKEFEKEIVSHQRVLRPANFSDSQPGKGWGVFRNPAGGDVAVINLLGKVFVRDSAYCPFERAEAIVKVIPKHVKTIIVDFHAEATSEKIAMGRFLDGKVTAVLGTHTHVRTGDAQVFPGATAFCTDVGMVGSVDSVLGREISAVIRKFRSGMPTRLPVVEKNIQLDAVIVTYDHQTGKASDIQSISISSSH